MKTIQDIYNIISQDKINKYGLTKDGLAMFLAQLHHESAGFTSLNENLNYSAKGLLTTFPKYFNEQKANECERKPQAIANIVYSNRMGNGDTTSGEGYTYRGRGYIQLTGKNNYRLYGELLNIDLIDEPDLLLDKNIAIDCALLFFKQNHILNDEDVKHVTKVINGGFNGLAERIELFGKYKNILSLNI